MKVSTGVDALDKLLDGGFEKDTITIIYGPGGSGKTNICMQASLSIVAEGKKVIYIDTEGGSSYARISQLENYSEEAARSILFLKPTTFEGQRNSFEKMKELMSERIGAVFVDSIAMLYRLEIGKSKKVYDLNRDLGRQISTLSQIARKNMIPVIVTNQVYSSMDGNTVMVGGDLLKYQSKCLIELQKLQRSQRLAILRKHRSIPEDATVEFEIREKGLFMQSGSSGRSQ